MRKKFTDTYIDYPKIGRRLAKIRDMKKLSQEEVSAATDISLFYYSKIENGRAKPTLELLSILAHYYQVDLTRIITGVSMKEDTYIDDRLASICQSASPTQLDLIASLAETVLKAPQD